MSLVHHWTLQDGTQSLGAWNDGDTTRDVAGGLDLTSNSVLPITRATDGLAGAQLGASFFGSSRQFDVASPPASALPAAGMTYMFALKPTAGTFSVAFDVNDASGANELRFDVTSQQWRATLTIGGTVYSKQFDNDFALNQPQVVAVVIPDPVGRPTMYLNGVAEAQSNSGADGGGNVDALVIGARAFGTNSGVFYGSLYDVRVYDQPLSAAEVTRLTHKLTYGVLIPKKTLRQNLRLGV